MFIIGICLTCRQFGNVNAEKEMNSGYVGILKFLLLLLLLYVVNPRSRHDAAGPKKCYHKFAIRIRLWILIKNSHILASLYKMV